MSDISNVSFIFFYMQIVHAFFSLQLMTPALLTEEDDDDCSDEDERNDGDHEGAE